MTKKEATERKANAVEVLHRLVPEGARVYTMVTKVAPSGASRHIRVMVIHEDRIEDITGFTCQAVGFRFNRDTGAAVVSGGGMDMGFHTVDCLSKALGRRLVADRL